MYDNHSYIWTNVINDNKTTAKVWLYKKYNKGDNFEYGLRAMNMCVSNSSIKPCNMRNHNGWVMHNKNGAEMH